MFKHIYDQYKKKEKIFGIKKEAFIGWTLFLIVFITIHLISEPTFVDDKKFRLISEKNNYDVLSIAIKRYSTRTSRFLIDLTNFAFISLPSIIWKVFDIAVLAICYKVLAKLSNYYIGMAFLICAYPFQHMASAGWVASTINYLWPFTAALGAFYILYSKKNESSISYSILYILLMIFASFSEIMSSIYIIALVIYFIIEKQYNKNSINIKWYLFSFIICLAGVINALANPGNKARIPTSIKDHMPEYYLLSWFDKFRICTVSTLQHFTSLPNILFLVFGFLLLVIGIRKTKKIYEKIICAAPLFISIIVSAYYFCTNIIVNRNFHYVYTDILLNKGLNNKVFNYLLLGIAILYLVTVIWSLIIINDAIKDGIVAIAIILCGLLSRFLLITSPTMLASGPRMYFVFYISIILVSANMLKKINSLKIKTFVYIALIMGIIANIGMVYLTQIHQG